MLLADGDLLRHRHHMLTRHLPGMEPDLKRVQGLFIANGIREVVVELKRDRETKSLSHKVDREKGIPELLGSNFTYLRLGQVDAQEDLPIIWRELVRAPRYENRVRRIKPCDQGLKARLPASITCYIWIQLSDWFSRQWERGERDPFPDLTVLLRNM